MIWNIISFFIGLVAGIGITAYGLQWTMKRKMDKMTEEMFGGEEDEEAD